MECPSSATRMGCILASAQRPLTRCHSLLAHKFCSLHAKFQKSSVYEKMATNKFCTAPQKMPILTVFTNSSDESIWLLFVMVIMMMALSKSKLVLLKFNNDSHDDDDISIISNEEPPSLAHDSTLTLAGVSSISQFPQPKACLVDYSIGPVRLPSPSLV